MKIPLEECRRSFPAYYFWVSKLDVSKFHFELMDLVAANKHVSVMAPRQHGKSETIAVNYPIWCAWSQPKKYRKILVISSVDSQSSKILERIKEVIDSNPVLNHLKPTVLRSISANTKWAATEIRLTNGVSIVCSALTPSLRGGFYDLIVCDDILRDEAGYTMKTRKLFFEVVLPMLGATKGQIVVLGTPQSLIDLLHELEKTPDFVTRRYQAVSTNEKGEWLEPLWPQRYSLAELEQIRARVGAVSWSREYMCKPVNDGSALYPYSIIEPCIDANLPIETRGDGRAEYFLGQDVAVSDKDSADYCAFAVGKRTKGGKLEVVNIERFKGRSTTWQLEHAVNLANSFNFRRAVVEQIGVSYDLANNLIQHPVTATCFEPFVTNHANKERILSGVEIMLRNKQIVLPKNDELIDELMAFGVKVDARGKQTYEGLGRHDDMVMALAMMVEASRLDIGSAGATIL